MALTYCPPTLAFYPNVPVCVLPTAFLHCREIGLSFMSSHPALTTQGCWYSRQGNTIHLGPRSGCGVEGRLLCLPPAGHICLELTPNYSTLLRDRLDKTTPGRELSPWTISAAIPPYLPPRMKFLERGTGPSWARCSTHCLKSR